MRDPYSVLGVKRDAGADEIKAAWRTKAKSIHPDQNRDDPDATMRFAEVGQAYDVLKDPTKRTRYDQMKSNAEARQREQTIMQQREAAREAAERAKVAKANAERVMEELARAEAEKAKADQASPAAQAKQAAAQAAAQAKQAAAQAKQDPASGQAPGGETPDDMISRIFGASAQASPAADAVRREAEAMKTEQPEPAGDGARAAAPGRPIAAIDLLASLVRRIRGIQPMPDKAPDIAVQATVTIQDLINKNGVTVTLPEGRDIRFTLEAGHSDGHVVRLKEYGLKLQGMQRGDVVVTLKVSKAEGFTVDGVDIHTVLPVTLENAVLGSETTVETPTGTAAITIPPWSGSDRTIRLEGEGLHDADGGRGALVVELRVMLWDQPDDKVTDLMRVMRQGLFL